MKYISSLFISLLCASASFAASAVRLPSGDLTVTNGDIKLEATGAGILFPGPSGGLQTIPFTGTAVSATNASTANSALTAGSADTANFANIAITAENLLGQYYGEFNTFGCTGTSVAACSSSCSDQSGNNLCKITKLIPYPTANWTRVAFITHSNPGTYTVELDPNLVRCFGETVASWTAKLEVRMQPADANFPSGIPPANWPNDSYNKVFSGQRIISDPGSAGIHTPDPAAFVAKILPDTTLANGDYHVFVKATPSSSYSDSNNCYFMRTIGRLTFLPAGQTVDARPR